MFGVKYFKFRDGMSWTICEGSNLRKHSYIENYFGELENKHL